MRNHPEQYQKPLIRTTIAIAIALAPFAAAQAYVGPGAGLSLLGALWGVLAAVGAALLFVIMWPIRKMRRRKREAQNNPAQAKTQDDASADETSPNS